MFGTTRARVFVNHPQAILTRWKNAFDYDACATGPSFYTYVGNDPTDRIDPTGKSMCANTDCSKSYIEPNPGTHAAPSSNNNEDVSPGVAARDNVAGAPGPQITFHNDNPNGASPDQPVTTSTANMVESAVVNSGVSSVNINSTTGGTHAPASRHAQGKAVDINRIDGKKVSDPSNRQNVETVQHSFSVEPNVRENFGPSGSTKVVTPGTSPVPWTQVQENHENHVHESGQQ